MVETIVLDDGREGTFHDVATKDGTFTVFVPVEFKNATSFLQAARKAVGLFGNGYLFVVGCYHLEHNAYWLTNSGRTVDTVVRYPNHVALKDRRKWSTSYVSTDDLFTAVAVNKSCE